MGPVERVEGSRKFTTTDEKTMASAAKDMNKPKALVGNGKDPKHPNYLPFSEEDILGAAEQKMADEMHATVVPLDPPDLMVRELVLPFVCHALISFP